MQEGSVYELRKRVSLRGYECVASHRLELLLMTLRHGAFAEPHEEGNRQRKQKAGAHDDEPAETLRQWWCASEEGAASVVRRPIVGLVPGGGHKIRN